METIQLKDRKDAIVDSALYIAEEAFIQRSMDQFRKSDDYKEYLKR